MRIVRAGRSAVSAVLAGVVLLWAAPAAAQFRPPAEPAVGEDYNIEGSIVWWNPEPSLIVTSTSIGIQGTDVDLVSDLGIEQKRLREFRLVLKPARKHKFRLNYTPIEYKAEAQVQREFIFNGQLFRIGVPVNTSAKLNTWRVGYEYDFIARSRGYAGVQLDLRYTDVDIGLATPVRTEFTRQAAPIPTLGFTGRGYPVPYISITGEFGYFKIPDALSEQFEGEYVDYDFYGTVNFNRNTALSIGYRKVDVDYLARDADLNLETDSGNLTFKGWYFAGVLRF